MMRTQVTITAQQLIDAGACKDAVRAFRELFGESAEVTEDACVAVADLFDWDWAARNLLMSPALGAYIQATAPALEDYDQARVRAWENYHRQAMASASKAYMQAMAPASKAYRLAKARAWCRAFCSQRGA